MFLFPNSFVFDVLTTSDTTSVAAMVFHFIHQKATQTYSCSFIYNKQKFTLQGPIPPPPPVISTGTAMTDYVIYLQSTTCNFK